MKYIFLWVFTPLGGLLLGSAAVTASPVYLSVCSGASCWNGDYAIADGVIVNWENVEAMQNGTGTSVNDWEATRGLDLSGWSLSMDSDPFVTNNFAITNTSTSTQTFSLATSIGITPAIPNGLMLGTIGFSLTDNNGDGATLATSGSAIYQGLIDGSTARTLWVPATSFTAPVFESASGNTSFGIPTRENAPESIDSTIGILISFSLTAGDSASFTSNFNVTPVPLPPALWLFGSGLLGLLGISKRKKGSKV